MAYGRGLVLVLGAVAGLSQAAAGQHDMTFFWSVSDTGNGDGVVEPGESLLTRLLARMEPGQTGFAGATFSIAGNDEWQRGTIESFDNRLDELSDDGLLHGDNSITDIESFQLPPLFNGNFQSENPIVLFEVVWTPENGVYQHVEWGTFDHLNADVYTDASGTSVSYTSVPGSASITIPTPGALTVLGAAGALGCRRRRS